MRKDKSMCVGCHSDFYNGNNNVGIKECWLFRTAKVVTRERIGWWVRPESAGNFTRVTTLNCHTETGQYAFLEKLPKHIVRSKG